MKTLLIFLIVFFKIKSAEAPAHLDMWVNWNIGQGQWLTHITNETCRHFDVGGEFGTFKRLKKSLIFYCGKKRNELILSHWDLDHFFNIPSLAKSFPGVCWLHKPEFAAEKPQAQKIIALKLSPCPGESPSFWQPARAETTNDSSAVFMEQEVLIPGDSPIQQEKLWAYQVPGITSTRVLILGHHGSRTSTGRDLLSQLPHLKYAISSARYARYHHPHPDTLGRLQAFHIPVLKTEDWGNIWFQ